MSKIKEIQTITDVTLDPHNANAGTERGLYVLDDSLAEVGAGRSIVADRGGTVLAGNKTLQVAADKGFPVRVVQTDGTELVIVQRTDLDLSGEGDVQRRAQRLALLDNRAAELGLEWDPAVLLAMGKEDATLTDGLWRDDEWEELLGDLFEPPDDEPPPLAQLDKADELQEKWQVSDGDVWQCGPHFIICADCREPATWARLLALAEVEKVNGVFTSPPYAEQRKKQYGGVPVDEYVDWWEAVQDNVRGNLAADGSFFVNIKPHCEGGERVLYVFDLVLAMRRRWGWRFVDELCWHRGGYPGKWPNRFKNEWEGVYHFSQNVTIAMNHREVVQEFASTTMVSKLTSYNGLDNAPARGGSPFKQKWKKSAEFDGALPGNVLKIPHTQTATATLAYQAAPFPVALPDFFIRAYSDPGDVWIDPFLGSATTICAAHQNDRRGIGIERLEKYVSVCLERLTGMGLEPVRIESQ